MSETVPTRTELAQLLVALEVPSDAYSLDGGHRPERYELDRRGER